MIRVKWAQMCICGLVLAGLPAVAYAAARIAVQPFGSPETEPLRKHVAKILGKHGYRPIVSLAAVQGTSQYPGLAKDHRITAFVVADVTESKRRTTCTFLIWQGMDGSVVGRWETSGSKKDIFRKLSKDFWRRLGRAIGSAKGHPSHYLSPAPPMRINAGDSTLDSAS